MGISPSFFFRGGAPEVATSPASDPIESVVPKPAASETIPDATATRLGERTAVVW